MFTSQSLKSVKILPLYDKRNFVSVIKGKVLKIKELPYII